MLLHASHSHQFLLTSQDPASPVVLVRLYQVRTKIIVAVADNGHFGLIRDKTVVVCFLFQNFSRHSSSSTAAPGFFFRSSSRQQVGSRAADVRRQSLPPVEGESSTGDPKSNDERRADSFVFTLFDRRCYSRRRRTLTKLAPISVHSNRAALFYMRSQDNAMHTA